MLTRLFALLASVSTAIAAPPAFTKIGDHPVSIQTPYPAILSITPYHGRLYFGYGDYNYYPPNILVSYDPVDRFFRLEHSVASDAVDPIRVLGNDLWVPHVDPIHFEDFQDFSFKRDGVWHEMAPMGCYHVFDCLQSASGAIYIAGSDWVAGGLLARSRDNGRTWQALDRNLSPSRYHWCFELNGRIYTQGGSIDDASDTFTRGGPLTSVYYWRKPTKIVPESGLPFVLGLYRYPGSESSAETAMTAFDGTTVQSVASAVDFSLDGSNLYVLNAARQLMVAQAPTFGPLTFTDTRATGIPANALTLLATNGAFYLGTATGGIYGSQPEGAMPTALSTLNDLPAAHGRGLSFDQTTLAIGSPDTSVFVSTPMSGSATVWQEPAPGASSWSPNGSVLTPSPDLSGWFGKKVAISGDLMAVVESGADATNQDRGNAALVRLFRWNGSSWVAAASQTVPYAHSVALVPALDAMVVGTGNPSASQTAGTPSLNVYGITRGVGGIVTLVSRGNLVPSSTYNYWGYKPVTRVALVGDWVIGSFAGDPSRNGGQGMVVGWKKTASNPTTFSTTQGWQQFPGTEDRFGHGLSADGEWIAIGAPRDDTAAANAGAVYLYKLTNGVPETTPRQKLLCPVADENAEFGYSVALRGKTLLVGAPGLADGQDLGRGAAFVFQRNGNIWTAAGSLTRPASSVQRFGIEVAIGDVWMAAASRISAAGTSAIDSLALVRRPDPNTAFDRWIAASAPALGVVDPTADPDHDGMTALMEYVYGLKANVFDVPDFSGATLPMPLSMPVRAGGGTTVDFAYPANDSRLSVAVESSMDLLSWAPSAEAPVTLGNTGTYSRWQQPFPPGPERYFRLRASYRR